MVKIITIGLNIAKNVFQVHSAKRGRLERVRSAEGIRE